MYYTDGNMDPKWVDSEAETVANSLYYARIKSSQLRKFYSDVKTLERTWKAQQQSDAAFQSLLPLIKILKAKAMYACGRSVVPPEFADWIQKHVNSINKPQDFKAFLLHFEAVVGYCYGLGLKD